MSVVGLDIGTSRVKAVRFDERWAPVDVATRASAVTRSADGRREQDMDQVRTTATDVLAEVVHRSADRVSLVAITGQGDGCWLGGADGRPVGPALLWNDSRAASIVGRWQADGLLEQAFRYNGCLGAPGLAHAQLAWLQQHRPETVERAGTLSSCGSWVYAGLTGLTGRTVLEVTDAANPFCGARTEQYEPAILDLFGLAGLGRLLPDIVAGPGRVAEVSAPAARATGLVPGTPVAIAPYDVPATAVGTGAIDTDDAFAVLGTTLCVGVVTDDPHLDREPNGMTLPGSRSDRWLTAYATMVGTEVLDWAAGSAIGPTSIPAASCRWCCRTCRPPANAARSSIHWCAGRSTGSTRDTRGPTWPWPSSRGWPSSWPNA